MPNTKGQKGPWWISMPVAIGVGISIGLCSLLGAFLFAGCTITPKTVRRAEVSFDGAFQDAGFLGFAADGSGYISEAARARYNALIGIYGAQFLVPLKRDDGIRAEPVMLDEYGIVHATGGLSTTTMAKLRAAWVIDAEHLVKFETMARWRKEHK